MANTGIIQEKQQLVSDITNKLQTSVTTVVTDYRGLTVKEVTELRKTLRDAGIDFKVYKNSLTRRATAETNLTELDEFLTGPNAIAFGGEDAVAPAKIIADFAKKHKALEIKAGVVEGKVVGVEQIKALADLPSREGLLSMLLSVLQAPMRNLALAVKAVAEKDASKEA